MDELRIKCVSGYVDEGLDSILKVTVLVDNG